MGSSRAWTFASIVASIASLGGVGCQSMSDCAQETFSKEFSCPKDSVAVRERNDVDGWAVTHDPPPNPPKEIEEDPARYQVWKQDQAEEREQFNKTMHDIYEAKGCKHEALYACGHPSNPGAPSTNCSRLGPAK
jgi:hypothetical protein